MAINNGIYSYKQRKKNKADSLTNTLQKSPTGPSRIEDTQNVHKTHILGHKHSHTVSMTLIILLITINLY